MKNSKYIIIVIFLLNSILVFSQNDSALFKKSGLSKFTIEPGIGIKPYPISDLLISNFAQWNIKKQMSIVSYTAYSINNAFLKNFNYIKTDYNFSFTQKFGIGTSVCTKHSMHTFSLMAGIKYDSFKETLDNPEFEKVTVEMSSSSPDFGLMYNLKVGQKKYFFSYRMYLPLYPYPFLTSDVNSMDANLANISMEVGIGVRLH